MTAVMERVTEDATEAAEPALECAHCLETVEDVTGVKSGEDVCEDCIAAYFSTCEDCDEITPDGDMTTVDRGYRTVCDDCLDSYPSCDRCDEHVPDSDIYSVYCGNEHVCSSCFDYYNYCDSCDYYVHSDDEDHYHDTDSSSDCCDSPAIHFVMPNGTPQDETIEVTLPDGLITASGMEAIRTLIYQEIPYNSEQWLLRDRLISASWNVGMEYVSKDGKYSKRIAKYLHKTWGEKAPDALLSKIGQAAQKSSVGGTKRVAFTRQLNLPADEFYHEGSCWWTEYSHSRCTLKSNGGLGIRTFDENGYVSGRAWAFPLRLDGTKLVPTFDTTSAVAFVVFNGYGELSEADQGRVLAATMEGWASKRVSFDPGNMYVNNGGFLVGPSDILEGRDWMEFSTDLHSDLWAMESSEIEVAA